MEALNIMLDVGARNGESLEEFVRWPFREIHAYEPMPGPYANIPTTDPRVHAYNYGLSDRAGTQTIYGDDQQGEASVYADKVDIHTTTTTQCHFEEASHVVGAIPTPYRIYMKLNCEGSEIPILHNLCDTGLIHRIYAFRVEFDISRVPGHDTDADDILARLASLNYTNYTIGSNARITPRGLVDDVEQVGVHADRMRRWLEQVWRP